MPFPLIVSGSELDAEFDAADLRVIQMCPLELRLCALLRTSLIVEYETVYQKIPLYVASHADVLRGGTRDEPKERLRGRLHSTGSQMPH